MNSLADALRKAIEHLEIRERVVIRKFEGEFAEDKQPCETVTIEPDGSVTTEQPNGASQ